VQPLCSSSNRRQVSHDPGTPLTRRIVAEDAFEADEADVDELRELVDDCADDDGPDEDPTTSSRRRPLRRAPARW